MFYACSYNTDRQTDTHTHTHIHKHTQTQITFTYITIWLYRSISLQMLHADLEVREAQLRLQEEELQWQNAEIIRLMGELTSCQAQTLDYSLPLIKQLTMVFCSLIPRPLPVLNASTLKNWKCLGTSLGILPWHDIKLMWSPIQDGESAIAEKP